MTVCIPVGTSSSELEIELEAFISMGWSGWSASLADATFEDTRDASILNSLGRKNSPKGSVRR
jgi:hypothetical protein